MGISRRDFIKYSGASLAASAIGITAQEAKARQPKIEGAEKTTSICPYCSVGCGVIVYTSGKEVVHIEGDPDHPISQGALCPKGASLHQLRDNPKRVTKPLYRASGESKWKEVTWDWAIGEIAKRTKKARDESFEKVNAAGLTVNRTRAIANVGSAALDNEEAYLIQKLMRGLGMVYLEHQARL